MDGPNRQLSEGINALLWQKVSKLTQYLNTQYYQKKKKEQSFEH